MSTETTERPQYLTDWQGLTLEEVRANAQEIDTVRARCLGSLSAAMFYSFNSLLSLKSYAEYGMGHEMIAKRAAEDFARIAKIVEDANEMYRRIDGKDLMEIPK
jgi:hypothetical protein